MVLQTVPMLTTTSLMTITIIIITDILDTTHISTSYVLLLLLTVPMCKHHILLLQPPSRA